MAKFLDFDGGDALKLVEDGYQVSRDSQSVRNNQYNRDYKLYTGFVDEASRDPDRANVFIPKTYSVIETTTPRDVKALVGIRPFIPFEARRREFREASRIQTDLLDEYLDRGGFFEAMVPATKIKRLYGTSFMDALPYHELVTEKKLVPRFIMGMPVGMEMQETQVPRLRLRLTVYAPWEIYVDPFATNLDHRGGCRFVIKLLLTSKRDILDMAKRGAYPQLDPTNLEDEKASDSASKANHWGRQMLSEIGLTQDNLDDDMGVIMRFESADRYIDVWNARVVLRDIPNPFKHGMINLSRYINSFDAHTQNQFWGTGEAKPGEILQTMLNDLWNMTLDNHNYGNQGMTYYREGAVHPDALVKTVGNKIAIKNTNDRPIGDSIVESFGQPLPRDHYMLPQAVERMHDLGSGVYENQRGEASPNDRTATSDAIRKEYGDSRQELNIRVGEGVFLKSFGEKCLSIIDQFATPDDIAEIVGVERAQMLITANPSDIPGGFNFTFKGADRVANLLMKQRNWKEMLPLLVQIPNVLQGRLAMKFLELFEVDDKTIQEMVIPDEIMMQMQQQAAQQQLMTEDAMAQREHERDMELADKKASAKESGNKAKTNKSKAKGMSHSKKQPSHSTKSEAQHQAGVTRGHR